MEIIKKNKSVCLLFLFFILSITTSIIPIIISCDLIQMDTYQSFISMLDKFYVDLSYFIEIVIQNMDYSNFNVFKALASLFTSLSIMNILIMILCIYLWAASKEKAMRSYNKGWKAIVQIYFFSYLVMFIILIVGFQINSLGTIMQLFKYVGIVMLIAHIGIISLSIRYSYKIIQQIINKTL